MATIHCSALPGGHPLAFALFMGWQLTYNGLVHTGYEFHPGVLNTPTNHATHHDALHGNFGLYFNVWDGLMRTNQPHYEARFREVTSRSKSARSRPSNEAGRQEMERTGA